MSDILFLLQRGWKNIWKEKGLWVFSALILIGPLVRLIMPIQKSADLISSFINLATSALTFISYAGATFVAYCIVVRKAVIIKEAFQVATKSFWRVIGSSFLFLLFIAAPFLCLVFMLSFKQYRQSSDFAHSFFFASILLSFLTAMWYFSLTEIVMRNSGIVMSLKSAWGIFKDHFAVLAVIGILITFLWHIANMIVGITTILIQYNFDFIVLGKLDFISPHLSFPNNRWYGLGSGIAQTIWLAYSTSIFVLAYLKYSGVKIDLRTAA